MVSSSAGKQCAYGSSQIVPSHKQFVIAVSLEEVMESTHYRFGFRDGPFITSRFRRSIQIVVEAFVDMTVLCPTLCKRIWEVKF